MKRIYLIRLDDACQTMEASRWERMERLLDTYGVKPLVGVIPCNADEAQSLSPSDPDFWEKVRMWEKKGWAIAMHGHSHSLTSENGGINPIWNKSEFAGLPLEQQKIKIGRGYAEFRNFNITPRYFFAPCHTFDESTLTALQDRTDIRIISDTVALRPYRYRDFIFIPQIGGKAREMKLPGTFTFCFHPSTMTDSEFDDLERFIQKNGKQIGSFSNLDLSRVKSKSPFDKFLSKLYFFYRRRKQR